jgi:hypothetical protein
VSARVAVDDVAHALAAEAVTAGEVAVGEKRFARDAPSVLVTTTQCLASLDDLPRPQAITNMQDQAATLAGCRVDDQLDGELQRARRSDARRVPDQLIKSRR